MKMESSRINQQLLDEFDPLNINTIKSIQKDLNETSIIKERLAFGSPTYTDIFRPIHSICPKYSYRSRSIFQNDVNMSVVSSSVRFDYVKLKIVDILQPELSEMNIYMTPQQLLQHTTTYFRYAIMAKPAKQKSRRSSVIDDNKLHMPRGIAYTPSQIHQYIKTNGISQRY